MSTTPFRLFHGFRVHFRQEINTLYQIEGKKCVRSVRSSPNNFQVQRLLLSKTDEHTHFEWRESYFPVTEHTTGHGISSPVAIYCEFFLLRYSLLLFTSAPEDAVQFRFINDLFTMNVNIEQPSNKYTPIPKEVKRIFLGWIVKWTKEI